ncbi:hypothetical protein JVT61DRAFT_10269 [Boletus reticuloceps]|uniref:Uncharacterized protein n=1 Tax=Boletus reticuloceps TaxID=495285 RepID=A0A8I2YW75_9AGAM|nr:hypothetical protein JVT61DRAFT_10269 [Boletus reticuloceps]
MSDQPESSNSRQIIAWKSAPPRVFSAKAARKFMPMQAQSGSSDRTATTSSQDSDSDGQQGQSNHDVRRHPAQARPTLVSKNTRGVRFEVPRDSDSDDATVREPSQRHVQQNLPTRSEPFQAPRVANQMKQSGTRKVRKSRGSALNQFEVTKWGSKFARKERRVSGGHYGRMSIGSASQRPSQSSNIPQQVKRRQWFLLRGNIKSRGRRGTSDQGDVDDGYDEDLHQIPTQKAAKSIRKSESQFPRKRNNTPSCESDNEVEHDINNSVQDSDGVVDEPALTGPSEDDEGGVLAHTEPSQTLLDRLERLSLGPARLYRMRRLPFLRRNLQKGFQLRCRMVGVDTKPHLLPRTSVSVIYNCLLEDDAPSHSRGSRTTTAKSSMKDWLCPLCDLHKKFDNPGMLDKHLAWDHSSVKVLWDQHYTTLSLTIPDSHPEPQLVTARQVPIRELSASEPSSDSRYVERNMSNDTDDKTLVRSSSTPSGARSESGSGLVSTPSIAEEDLKPKFDPSGYSSHVDADTWTRHSSLSGRSASRSLSGVDARDGLGPSVESPYLPESDERGDVYYSCRPGGPRLFDFLNTLSLKPYGVLKWVIIDREEELFELDDILDEDKVMQALWFRWIFLNRNRFVANYFDGTKTFVRENWELIKLGAGLLALRTWLLVGSSPCCPIQDMIIQLWQVLVVNNFLLPLEVATLMQYYQELAGIQLQV